MPKELVQLDTDYVMDENSPLSEYPRPQLRRDSYLCLNGLWKYKIFNDNNTFINYKDDIIVPFPIESKLSKAFIKQRNLNDKIGYKKEFYFPDGFIKDKVILHFEAVDQICDIYFNRNYVFHHEGGYNGFEIDITKLIKKNINEIVVICYDTLSEKYAYGRQQIENEADTYSTVSGIWQTVWMESVSLNYIKDINYKTNIDDESVEIIIDCDTFLDDLEKNVEVYFNGRVVKKCKIKGDRTTVHLDDMKLWSPEEPNLYDVKVSIDEDEVYSYFGMRKISIESIIGKKMICLNNMPYYLHGILDKGFYPDGLFTPKSYDIFSYEIKKIKELGFNTIRKYVKIECNYWYYLCDKYGIIVWQDLVNSGHINNFMDYFLPNKGFQKRRFIRNKVGYEVKKNFIMQMNETSKKLYNNPCVCLYTLFNEGWGEFDVKNMTSRLKELDNTRIIDSASGWFYKDDENDIDSIHYYKRKMDFTKGFLAKKQGAYNKPLVITEFGGYSVKINNHVYSKNVDFGYKKTSDIKDFNEQFKNLYERDIIANLSYGLSGSIYAQLSDVEEDITGILTFDRKVCKLDPDTAIYISNRLKCGSYGK